MPELNEIKKAAEIFTASTGIPCRVLDFTDINSDCLSESGCTICRRLSEISGVDIDCKQAMRYGSYQAERFGGRYIFFCPLGFTHFISPISEDGELKYAISGGPLLMLDTDDVMENELLSKLENNKESLQEFRGLVEEITYADTEKVTNLSELLFMVILGLQAEENRKLLDKRDMLVQQSDIGEYIQKIKSMGTAQDFPAAKERELIGYITSGDKKKAQKLLNEILGQIFFTSGNNMSVIKAGVLELIVILSRSAIEAGADEEQIFGMKNSYLNEVSSFENIEDLSFWLSKVMERYTDFVFNFTDVKHYDVIYKAIDYIRQNYMKKITLEDVSEYVALSPSYFSKVFNEEMKQNFNTYLNSVRISNAERMLIEEPVNLVDVAYMVGFDDQSYFSKVFKRITGMTPKTYKENRGKNKPLKNK